MHMAMWSYVIFYIDTTHCMILLGLLVISKYAYAFRTLSPTPAVVKLFCRNSATVKMSVDGLETLYNSLTSKLESTFDLKATDFTSTQDADTFNLAVEGGSQFQGRSTLRISIYILYYSNFLLIIIIQVDQLGSVNKKDQN